MTDATYPDLKGKLIVATGGGRGIGLATVRRFLAQGARVVVLDLANGDVDLEAEFVEVDVTDAGAVAHAADELVARLGAPDVVLNAAGIVRSASAEDMSAEDWTRVIDVNLSGTFHVCQAFGRHMLAAG